MVRHAGRARRRRGRGVRRAAVAFRCRHRSDCEALESDNAAAQQKGPPPRVIPVEVVTAELRNMPVRIEALGTVTPIASVAIKARLETMITEVHFRDGAMVNAGDLLFTLDSRQLEAEIKRVEAVIAGAVAQQEQAERDVRALQRTGRQERHHPGDAEQRADPGQHLARGRRFEPRHAREPEGSAVLDPDPRADFRTHQRGQCEGRQFRAPRRHRAACDHQPDQAGLCDLRAAAAAIARSAQGAGRRNRDR